MDMKCKDTHHGMVDEIVWDTTCTPVNQIYGSQTLVNHHQWVTNIITTMGIMELSKVECPGQKRSIEHLKYLLLRHITME
jgi:hypothetical protein